MEKITKIARLSLFATLVAIVVGGGLFKETEAATKAVKPKKKKSLVQPKAAVKKPAPVVVKKDPVKEASSPAAAPTAPSPAPSPTAAPSQTASSQTACPSGQFQNDSGACVAQQGGTGDPSNLPQLYTYLSAKDIELSSPIPATTAVSAPDLNKMFDSQPQNYPLCKGNDSSGKPLTIPTASVTFFRNAPGLNSPVLVCISSALASGTCTTSAFKFVPASGGNSAYIDCCPSAALIDTWNGKVSICQ